MQARAAGPWSAITIVLGMLTACPPGATTCEADSDCDGDLICNAAGTCVARAAEGEGEGEGEPARSTLAVEVGPGRQRLTSESFTLTGGPVGSAAGITVAGARFTLRPLTGATP